MPTLLAMRLTCFRVARDASGWAELGEEAINLPKQTPHSNNGSDSAIVAIAEVGGWKIKW